mgnify:CR=1 FL=1
MAATKAGTKAAEENATTPAAAKAKKPSAAAQTKAVKTLLALGGTDVFESVASSVENLTSKKALEVLPQLLDSVDNTYFAIGGIMARIHEESWWKDAGFESFKDYVEEECGQSYRTTMYWVSIYTDLIKAGVDFEQVANIGWSKLKEISGVMTEENSDEWIQRASEMSLKQLIEYVKAMKGGSTGGSDEDGGADMGGSDVKNLTFKVHDDQKASIEAAVQAKMESMGTEYGAVALTQICDEALTGEGGGSGSVSLGDAMAGAGFQKVLEEFEKQFPNIDLEVTVN